MKLWPVSLKRTIQSKKNGFLQVANSFGKIEVIVDGAFQSGRYMQKVFAGMLRMLEGAFVPKRILLVGLGAGGCIPIIQKRFPYVHIIALEYDEVMIALAKETYLSDAEVGSVEIIAGDVMDTLPQLSDEFDLVLVDLFCGHKVSPSLTNEKVLQALRSVLSWQGYLLVNLYKEFETVSKRIEHFFALHSTKRVLYNDTGLYRHYGMVREGEGVPPGFEDREQSRIYLQTSEYESSRRQIIEDQGMLGVRKDFRLFLYDRYVHGREPNLRSADKIRIVCWQPYKGTTFPGWFRIPDLLSSHFLRGVSIPDGPDYWKEWTSHARRHRKKFLQDNRFEIVEVDLDRFTQAYHSTKFMDPFTRRSFISVLRHHIERHSQDVHLTVARQRSDQRIVAGLATIDYVDISQSGHVIAFIHPDAQQTSVGVGLIDHWFTRCLHERMKFLHFGLLRRNSDPGSWQAYTNFKRQFHLHEILYPKPVFRIVWPK